MSKNQSTVFETETYGKITILRNQEGKAVQAKFESDYHANISLGGFFTDEFGTQFVLSDSKTVCRLSVFRPCEIGWMDKSAPKIPSIKYFVMKTDSSGRPTSFDGPLSEKTLLEFVKIRIPHSQCQNAIDAGFYQFTDGSFIYFLTQN